MPDSYPPSPWRWPSAPPPEARALARELGLPEWLGQVLLARGLDQTEAARKFLGADLSQLPTYDGMLGLDQALEVLLPALEKGSVIGVAGDYDADGVTASALLVEFFQELGAPVVWELPHRLEDGYGFSPALARRLHRAGAQVVVTVDCGISDHAGVAQAHELGMEVVVSDHHQIPPGDPVPARAVLNPQQEGCRLSGDLAGVGVAFYLAAGLRAALEQQGWFASRPKPNLLRSLDLVALGTCADLVPLMGANRVMVREGLKVLAGSPRVGLKALMSTARSRPPLSSRDLGFGLAPRINALGRLGHPGQALELLLTQDPAQAQTLAGHLEEANLERRRLEQVIFEQAMALVEGDTAQAQARCLVLAQPDWHRGVLGIVASRVMDQTGRPTLMLSLDNGRARGSGRSVPGFHLHQALASLSHLLEAFGGHAQAAGLSLPTANLPELGQELSRLAGDSLPPLEEGPALMIEAPVSLAELGYQALEPLASLGPFGQGNPEPLLGLRGVRVSHSRMLRDAHLKLELEQNGCLGQAIAFNWGGPQPAPGEILDLAATPQISDFRGRHIELVLRALKY